MGLDEGKRLENGVEKSKGNDNKKNKTKVDDIKDKTSSDLYKNLKN